MKLGTGFSFAGLILVAGLALAGCRAEEQGRPLSYSPGMYQGKADTQLSEMQVRELRQRTTMQSSSIRLSGGSPSRTADVSRPRTSNGLDWNALAKRLLEQETSEPHK